jgi:hypothetical protein
MSDRNAAPQPRGAAQPAAGGTLTASRRDSDHPVWIDLGCGDGKQRGFVGIDRFALPGVDIVCDLERGIPLAADSVDYLLASHSLEHLRDLPAAAAEIYRVCKDRAHVTIIAPYDATRLNAANPYHAQGWNEHTARFFTKDENALLDSAQFSFPGIVAWGLSATDHGERDVDLRCLATEFHYFPAYRGLDEDTKRTLRQSLADVCDQMALHLLVVKSPITQDELATRARRHQYPLPAAFEARRRAEADIGPPNLFADLAGLPARVTALAQKRDEEIGLLGAEIRRFVQRIDHIDRALVAETEETRRALADVVSAGRTLSERMTAINSALMRRVQTAADELHGRVTGQLADVTRSLADVTAAQSAQARSGERMLRHLVAERRARADRAFRPVRFLRRYRQRSHDLRNSLGGEMLRLTQGPEAPPAGAFKLQLGTFLEANVARSYRLRLAAPVLHGIEIGVAAMFAPFEPSAIAAFELHDGSGNLLRRGAVMLDQACGAAPLGLDFEPLADACGQPLVLTFMPDANVEHIGVQLLEWHRVSRVLRRVPELRLAYRARH